MKGKEKYKEFFEEMKPVTNEELEELLDPPKQEIKRKRKTWKY
ncbi:MAG: hypothetical protein NZ895_00725 [Archaeoglobaceae archaeon]|nr:hypothetical protein [Archaeoglobaceae archaeon]MCX8151943.1 hypothetical protein [Archaeoglobaceae archaeon]MDW8013332.1 hypothetical protein [Archaeoglobaceae archaeon]